MPHKLVVNKRDRIEDGTKPRVYVGRPTKWGNPFVIGVDGTRDEVIEMYRARLRLMPELREAAKRELRGKILVCWCAPQKCHADLLAEIANE